MDAPVCVDGRTAWLDNGRCRYHDAMVAAERGAAYPDELGLAAWSIVELVEAAVRSGQVEKAVRGSSNSALRRVGAEVTGPSDSRPGAKP